MSRFLYLIFLVLSLIFFLSPASASEIDIPLDADDSLNFRCLKEAYPQIDAIAKNEDGSLDLVFRDGNRIPYKRTFANGDDVAESMRQVYPLEPSRPDLEDGFAPGRTRSYPLLEALYGATKGEVQKNLKTVKLSRGKAALNEKAAAALASAAPELDKIALERPEWRKYLKIDGGFYWRNIAGENRPSAHSYGIAIDLGADSSPYWRWAKKARHPMQKTYPAEIVEILEKAGFVWGGKWDKYDLMHFEYRPELICKARELAKGRRGEF